jgi:thiol-disulfide isomerase/thioredoxin
MINDSGSARMKAITNLLTIMTLVTVVHAARGDESWEIRGKVVDEQGELIDDFVAAIYWSANGKLWDDSGNPIKFNQTNLGEYWNDEGVLEPFPDRLATGMGAGQFKVTVEKRPRVAIFVTDSMRRNGGYVAVEKNTADKPVTVTLRPLVRVTGSIYCSEANRTPGWTLAVVRMPGDMENYLQFIRCGSIKGQFSFLLPPGKFDLEVHSEFPDAHMPKPIERKNRDAPRDMPKYLSGIRIEVPRGQTVLDLGMLDVVPNESDTLDYVSQFYGKKPPELAITDARGVPKNVKLADFRGKWVLLDFWGLSCVPCINVGLPKLSKFYEEHKTDRDRFEILAICNNWNDDVRTMKEFDRLAAPIVDAKWDGKPLPFPILIDGDGKTFEAYGVGSVPTTLLIDPDGNLLNGNDEVLAEKLREDRR